MESGIKGRGLGHDDRFVPLLILLSYIYCKPQANRASRINNIENSPSPRYQTAYDTPRPRYDACTHVLSGIGLRPKADIKLDFEKIEHPRDCLSAPFLTPSSQMPSYRGGKRIVTSASLCPQTRFLTSVIPHFRGDAHASGGISAFKQVIRCTTTCLSN